MVKVTYYGQYWLSQVRPTLRQPGPAGKGQEPGCLAYQSDLLSYWDCAWSALVGNFHRGLAGFRVAGVEAAVFGHKGVFFVPH